MPNFVSIGPKACITKGKDFFKIKVDEICLCTIKRKKLSSCIKGFHVTNEEFIIDLYQQLEEH